MLARFVCLANSYKEGGRCVAGILLDRKNNPIIQDSHPKWIRPVSLTNHGEIPTDLVSDLDLLTILEIEILDYVGEDHQSENALFDENSIREIGTLPISSLSEMFDHTRPKIFDNRGKAVAEEEIGKLDHSLMLVRTTEFEFFEKPNEHKPGTTQIKSAFSYNNIPYEFVVTDPIFLRDFRDNPKCIEGVEEIYLTLSLAIKWQGWYHKLVAGVIFDMT